MSLSTRMRRPAAAVLSGVLASTALTLVATTSAEAAAGPTRVWITKYRNVKMADHLRPGVHRFVVRSAKSSGFQIVRPHRGYTKREAMRDIDRGFEGNVRAFKRFERNIVLKGGVSTDPGDRGVMWARLAPGKYWALDTNGPTLARKVDTFRVGGPSVGGRMPGRLLRATGQTTWSARPRTISDEGVLRFYNASGQSHFVDLQRLEDGKTEADFREWIEGGAQGAPPLTDVGIGTGVVDANRAMSMRYDLPPGNYILTCWWPDPDMDMMPHAFMGMYREIRLR